MVDKIELSPEAKRELFKASCYFKLFDKEEAFLDAFFTQLDRISAMPTAFQIRYRDVRVATLKIFSYTIHYMVYKNVVYILHFFSQRQDY